MFYTFSEKEATQVIPPWTKVFFAGSLYHFKIMS
jgi:hypothetical protein